MERTSAALPDSVAELCLVRFGLVARRWTARRFVRSMARAIADVSRRARAAGLLNSEAFRIGPGHHGVLQYWSGFDALDAWTRQAPHADWWRAAVERMRGRGDLGVYHEAYLVPRTHAESIYMNCPPIGLASFGALAQPVGSLTTARDRLRRRPRDDG